MRPKAREEGLIVLPLADETLVYDLERHRALCLNRLAAAVWHRCDGTAGVGELASGVSESVRTAIDEDVVRFALTRLARSHLLMDDGASSRSRPVVSRRDVLRRMTAAGVALVGVPAVVSVVAPTALQAQASCAGLGELCNVLPCCPGLTCTLSLVCVSA